MVESMVDIHMVRIDPHGRSLNGLRIFQRNPAGIPYPNWPGNPGNTSTKTPKGEDECKERNYTWLAHKHEKMVVLPVLLRSSRSRFCL